VFYHKAKASLLRIATARCARVGEHGLHLLFALYTPEQRHVAPAQEPTHIRHARHPVAVGDYLVDHALVLSSRTMAMIIFAKCLI
jgi:hypothetical protein